MRAALLRWATALTGSVVLPRDAGYDAARRVWNLDIDRRPAAIVRCASERDVSRAIGFARDHGLPLAVRGGGHSQAGHSVCDGGIVIDLGAMSRVELNTETRVARVLAGARVSQLLDATTAAGMATPTGGCPDVGLGGLTLGGGESLLMAKHGAVCDNLLSAQVVTAAGRTMTASPLENPDLFWAIRGGGGNFGIVTRFDFRLHPLERVLSGRFIFPVRRTREVLFRYRDLIANVPDEMQTSAGLVSAEQEPQLFIAVCHCGDAAAAWRLIDEWRARLAPESDTIAWAPYAADFILPPVAGSGTGAFLPGLDDTVIDLLADSFSAAPRWCTAAWNDFHGAVTRVPVDAMAFPLRHPGYDVFVHACWKAPEERQAALAWLDALHRALRPHSRGVYVNNIGTDRAARTADAYSTNYERLTAIKAAYDPDNVFRLNHNIEPRLPASPDTRG